MADTHDDDKIHRIVNDKLESYDIKVDKKLNKLDIESEKASETLQEHSLKLTEIKGTLSAIYGNGSGKPGILDEIKAEQKKVSNDLDKETANQAKFRHELRNEIESIKLMKASELKAAADTKQDNRQWFFWVAGGVGFVSWELIKIFILKVK